MSEIIAYSLPKLKNVLVILLLGLGISACAPTSSTTSTKWNLATIYNPSQSNLHPSYKIYHNFENTSLLYVKIFTNELSFQPVGQNGEIISQLSLNYVMTHAEESQMTIVDSGTYDMTIVKKASEKHFLSQFPLKAESGKSYRLKLIMRDKLNRSFTLNFIEVEKKPEFGQQYFNLTYIDGSPVFRNVIIGNGAFRLAHPNPNSNKLYISYYKNNVPLPKPTFASEDILNSPRISPDSTFIINYSASTAISLAYNGLYFFQFDTNSPAGVTILKFDSNFPKVTKPQELIEPLAYITTTGEYQRLISNKNIKMAADDFWINAGGNTDRGREMVRIYYNRVYFSNYYFTTTREGWKTDRGMVYIVYGPPHNLKKTNTSEIWHYYNKGGEPIEFTFDYIPNKFSIGDYHLERSENHTWHWREAVYAWTNGEIFLQN